ncbi:uncharacterized protein [Solanum tuberosum]|uniref:uncharacterized protein n=1 Tax=Solanum tuberosum TaxID=4113 RepID=UPI00073A32E2|nr:PREDICTED: uncharacterized protein LOC107059510 [Solanum tuberosum]
MRRINERMMTIKLVSGELTLNIVSAYAPQINLDEEAKKLFSEDFDEVYQTSRRSSLMDILMAISRQHLVVLMMLIRFGFGESNGGGASLLDFAKTFESVIANSCYPKRENYFVTFQSTGFQITLPYYGDLGESGGDEGED